MRRTASGVGLREELERVDVAWTHHREVAVVEGGDLGDAQPLGRGDDRGINCAQGEISVLAHELTHPHQVSWLNLFQQQVSCRQCRQQPNFRFPRGLVRDQMGDL